jgi:hypothetical protein
MSLIAFLAIAIAASLVIGAIVAVVIVLSNK